jgi:hypothetical protein
VRDLGGVEVRVADEGLGDQRAEREHAEREA